MLFVNWITLPQLILGMFFLDFCVRFFSPCILGLQNLAMCYEKRNFASKMKIVLIVVGKTQDKHLQAMMDDYRQRIVHYIPFEMEVQPELKNTRGLSMQQQKEREGRDLLDRLDQGDWVVLLDERGREWRSVEFADYLDKRLQRGGHRLVFVIGGPYGFSQDVYDRANEKLSLSQMTFSHQMIRLLFLEQLYRAETILHGEPYHHE